jgi:uncharacterized membrane protein
MMWEHSAVIDAPADLVWRLTVDVANWPSFVPTVRQARRLDPDPLRVGSATRLKQPGQPSAVWTVTRLDPPREFTWETRRPGLRMAGSHRVEALPSGCRNTLTIEVSGPLSGLFGVLFGGVIRKAIQAENEGFAKKALT